MPSHKQLDLTDIGFIDPDQHCWRWRLLYFCMFKKALLDDDAGRRVDDPSLLDEARLHAGSTPRHSVEIISRIAAACSQLSGCRHCGARRIQKWGNANGLARYRCAVCGKTFNALTGTPFARLRQTAALAAFFAAREQGLSVRESALRCGIAAATSLRWRRKFRQQVDGPAAAFGADTPVGRIGGAK